VGRYGGRKGVAFNSSSAELAWGAREQCRPLSFPYSFFLAAVQDEMLGAHQMRELYALREADGEAPWEWVEFPMARHMDAYDVAPAQYWPAIVDFLQRLQPAPKPQRAQPPQ
jgi:hypothetical protein